MTDFLQDQAALYALGLLDPEEARALEQLIPSDPALATLVRDLQDTLATTTRALPAAGVCGVPEDGAANAAAHNAVGGRRANSRKQRRGSRYPRGANHDPDGIGSARGPCKRVSLAWRRFGLDPIRHASISPIRNRSELGNRVDR